MWNKPWQYKEGTAICLSLMIVGAMLQLSVGPINWDLFAAPVNIIFLCVYIAVLVIAFLLKGKVYAIRWSMTYYAAVPAILVAGISTVVYGITCDRATLTAWPFVLIYFWLATILGLTCLKRIKSFAFLLNHLGLFIALVAATLGSADMKRMRMTIEQEQPEWRCTDESGNVQELDLAIKLNHFAIEEYPPKLIVVNNSTGKVLPEGRPASLVLEDSIMSGVLLGHNISVLKVYQYCAQFAEGDTLNYVPWTYSGATTAALVSVDGKEPEWVSNGSYMFPFVPSLIDTKTSLVMAEGEPKKYTSNVDIYTKSGEKIEGVDIEVNHPYEINGWKIYQLSYDGSKGRWSDTSVLELVRDPWLPYVYLGIFMLLAGAVWMFVTAGKRH